MYFSIYGSKLSIVGEPFTISLSSVQRSIERNTDGAFAVSLHNSPDFDLLLSLMDTASRNKTITRVHLYGNLISNTYSDADLFRMLSKLFQFRSLKSVGLRSFRFSRDMIELICDWVAPLTLQSLYIEKNDLTNDGLRAVGRLVTKNTFLNTLSISVHDTADNDAIESFLQCLCRNFTIKDFFVDRHWNSIVSAGQHIALRNRQWENIRKRLILFVIALFPMDLPLYVVLELVHAHLRATDSYASVCEQEFPQYLKVELLQNVLRCGNDAFSRR